MSRAITALVLMSLRAQPGQWVTVAHMAAYMALPAQRLQLELEHLAAAGDVELQRDAADQITAGRIAPDAVADKSDRNPEPHPLPHRTGLERIERPSGAPAGHFHPTEEPA